MTKIKVAKKKLKKGTTKIKFAKKIFLNKQRYNKNQGCLEKIDDRYDKNQVFLEEN